MELWIRSQDKTRLIKINSLEYVEYQGVHSINGYYTNESDNYDLGVYSTKERTLEVLDEIEGYIKLKYLYELKEYAAIKTIINGVDEVKASNNMIVYEMPEN